MSQYEFPPTYDDLSAVFLNCTLKPSPQRSNTEGLIAVPKAIMEKHGVSTTILRAVDHDIAPGVYPDMREHGAQGDVWPRLSQTILMADILVIATPIWLGEPSSVCRRIVERLYSLSSETQDNGQYIYYGKVAGCLVDGNEDGGKHCSMNLLYSMQHIGYTIPPQADAYWTGEAGPGPSYLDEGSGGPHNEFTNRKLTFMSWNLMHMARMLKDAGGVPAYGNQSGAWSKGERFGFESSDYPTD